ncbi:hypothetical protein GENT5_17000 [Flavobacterium ammoniigenes]|jgi:archaellin|uniref:Uncharacterized protein n=1 Tax=Flavobacterium ammoniigenes TaxID=1751095 RepID=A0ABN6L151_9FLAO|nr:hypothetical protein [Flavobacterium ammoniigenes]BDB55395.1 hypothetical protein GENT5_17000 [Flavobacterium ammoniigenes]
MKYFLLFLVPFFTIAQDKHLDFYLTTNLNKAYELKLIYNDHVIDASEDDQYSHILSNKLLKNLIKRGYTVLSPQDIKECCFSVDCNDFNKVVKEEKYIYLYIETQTSGARTTINGTIYQKNKIIGGFTSYRSYWTNLRFEELSVSISDKL